MIELKNISKSFKRDKLILNKINFTINKNDVIAYVGDNGAGKTTTIKAIFNELNIDEGEILIDGKNLFTYDNLKKIAFFPDSNSFAKNIKILEFLEYTCLVKNISHKVAKEKIGYVARELNITELLKKKFSQISSGQIKKVLFASVLIQDPEYIFFDEPTANLDVESKIELLEIINEISNLNIGVLITSHIIEELQQVANQLVLIDQGKIVFKGAVEKNTNQIRDLYLKYKTSSDKKVDVKKVFKKISE